jgi:hypothetical protein
MVKIMPPIMPLSALGAEDVAGRAQVLLGCQV